MAKIECGVTIARPVEDVFDYFLSLDEHVPENNPDIVSFVKTPSGPTRVGTTFRSRGRSLGRVRDTTMLFTAIVPGETIGFDAAVGPMRPRCSFMFQRTGGGTTVTFLGDPRPVGPFRMLSPVFVVIGRRVWRARLSRAKAVLEAGGAAPPSPPSAG